jgi:hypothetical protein
LYPQKYFKLFSIFPTRKKKKNYWHPSLKRILTRDTNIIAEYETTGRRNDTSEEDIERQLAGVLLAPGTAIHKSSTRHFSKQKKMKMDLSAQGVVQK